VRPAADGRAAGGPFRFRKVRPGRGTGSRADPKRHKKASVWYFCELRFQYNFSKERILKEDKNNCAIMFGKPILARRY
jgi:hypothetical protein